MAPILSEADIGKRVVTAAGDALGTVADYRGGDVFVTVTAEDHADVSDLGWHSGKNNRLDPATVERVDGDAVVLSGT